MRLSRSIFIGLVAMVLLLSVGTAFAQGGAINVGDTVTQNAANANVDFALSLSSGESVTIDVTSDAFDTYLEVIDASGAILSFDDDSGDAFNSRLSFTAPSSAVYTLRVRSFAGAANGRFTITVASGGGSTTTTTTTTTQSGDVINVGDTVSGNSTGIVEYTLQLAAGQTVTIEAQSTQFDTYLELYSGSAMVASDDDGGAVGTNSLLTFTAPSAGSYIIRVRAFGSDNAGGAFTVIVAGSGGSISQSGSAINVGDTINGSATTFADYSIALTSGQSVMISLTSEQFDTYLVILDSQGGELATNDDGGDGTNSRLVFTAPSSGTYTIRVGSCCVNPPNGGFTLNVAESQVVGEAQGGELTYGSSFTFEPNGAVTSVFYFTGRAGDIVNLTVESNTGEDTRLFVYGPSGAEVASDDDSGSGSNPALRRFELPETGSYTVEIQGYAESAVFDPFMIMLERTELLLLNNGPVTLSLNQDIQSDSIAFDVQAGQEYIVTISASERSDASMYIAIQEEGDFYARTSVNFSNIQVVSFLYTVEASGRADISVDYYAYEPQFVDFTFTVEPYTESVEVTPTPSK